MFICQLKLENLIFSKLQTASFARSTKTEENMLYLTMKIWHVYYIKFIYKIWYHVLKNINIYATTNLEV